MHGGPKKVGVSLTPLTPVLSSRPLALPSSAMLKRGLLGTSGGTSANQCEPVGEPVGASGGTSANQCEPVGEPVRTSANQWGNQWEPVRTSGTSDSIQTSTIRNTCAGPSDLMK